RQLLFQSAALSFEFCQARPSLLGRLREDRLEAPRIPAQLRDLRHHDPLHLAGRDGLRRATLPAPLLRYRADVIAIAFAALGDVRRGHGAAARPPLQQPFEDYSRPVPAGHWVTVVV